MTTATATVDRGDLLLTGATGLVGSQILWRALAREPHRRVIALVRAADDAAAGARLDRVLATGPAVAGLARAPEGWRDRLVAVAGDTSRPLLGLDATRHDALAASVGEVVHSAAAVSFAQPLDEARAANLEGSRHVAAFAVAAHRRRPGGLVRHAHVSTAYVAGTHAGRFAEDDLRVGQRFRNAYEQSKCEAEEHVRGVAAQHGLPVQILRPSIVVGDSQTGWTSSFNVLYGPLRAYAVGALTAVPGRRASPVDVVPVDYVADAILALATTLPPPGATSTYHLVAGDAATSVGELVDLAAAYFTRRRARIVAPRLWRLVVEPLVRARAPQTTRRALARAEVLFGYFAMRVRLDDTHARAALAPHGIVAAPLPETFATLMDYAVAARWGRGPAPAPAARPDARRAEQPFAVAR